MIKSKSEKPKILSFRKLKLSKTAETNITGPQIIAVIVFLLVVFAVTYVGLIGPFFSKAPSVFGDEGCHFSAAIDNAVHGPAGGSHPLGLYICHQRSVEIEGDDWDKCPAQYKEEFDNVKTDDPIREYARNAAKRRCAAYQIAVYADRCWYMLGRNGYNLAALSTMWDKCFKITVRDIGENFAISEGFIKDVIKANKFEHGLTSDRLFFMGGDKNIYEGKAAPIKFCDDRGDGLLCTGDAVCMGNGCKD